MVSLTCSCGQDLNRYDGQESDEALCQDCVWSAAGITASHQGVHHYLNTGHGWTLKRGGGVLSRSEPRLGGIVSGGVPIKVRLADDECLLNRDLECQRRDVPHHHQMSELRDWGGALIRHVPGPCIHRHVIPVESVNGETVAHLCLNCDEQLP